MPFIAPSSIVGEGVLVPNIQAAGAQAKGFSLDLHLIGKARRICKRNIALLSNISIRVNFYHTRIVRKSGVCLRIDGYRRAIGGFEDVRESYPTEIQDMGL